MEQPAATRPNQAKVHIPSPLLWIAEDLVGRLDQLELLRCFLCVVQIFICQLHETGSAY